MSAPPEQTSVFIPIHLLEYLVVDTSTNKIETAFILEKATSDELHEFIQAFKPNLKIMAPERDNPKFLKKVFIEMVAPVLNNLLPSELTTKHYIQAPLRHPISGVQESPIRLTYQDEINSERATEFNIRVLQYLRSGQYYVAEEHLLTFIKQYNFLNENEISEIQFAKDKTRALIQEQVTNLRTAYQKMESTKMQLRQEVCSQFHTVLRNRKAASEATVEHHLDILNQVVKGIGFLDALEEYHKSLNGVHNPISPPSPKSMNHTSHFTTPTNRSPQLMASEAPCDQPI
ncbi:uncharacterized protein MELLADRAFT_94192 [Melampsora larici-populina 98AG31]|uniref:Uncharacterized protein n=1 Tax=Melampsora larici-populina (strain 98AG31 / pathotype 3-4-7) TaxID=747676 RepID=F4S6T6_MELLP|nr:uncharacterized protein MELLADRAFT_94192 [Melampsora larici-populina 98AG31]EGF99628.1 hypothetical protein MELLADRAFT_94192 [Melampsora larici-populina 98AG31]